MTTETLEPTQAAEPEAQAPEGTDELSEAKEMLATLETPQAEGETAPETLDGTEAEAPPETEDEDEVAAINARAERLAAEKLEQQEAEKRKAEEASREAVAQQKAKEARKQQFDQFAPSLRRWAEERLDPADVDTLLSSFTGYNGLVDDAYREELRTAYTHWAAQTLPDEVRADFQGKEYATTKDFFESYKAQITADARKGYVKETATADLEALAVVKLKNRFRKNPAALDAFLNSLNRPSVTGTQGMPSRGDLASYESRLARGETFNDSDWAAYTRLREAAGL